MPKFPRQAPVLDTKTKPIPSPYSSSKGSKRVHERGKSTLKTAIRDDTLKARTSYKELMDRHCESCHDQVRNCECLECPLWTYRSKKKKVHRALCNSLKSGQELSKQEETELNSLKRNLPVAQSRVIALAEKYCKQKTHWFRKAFGGNSRKAAVKAVEIYLANYDTNEVVPIEEWWRMRPILEYVQ